MCGRYHLTAPPERLGREFDLDIRENIPPRYNIAPTQPVLVVRIGVSGARELTHMRWGFIPAWAKGEALARLLARPLINARAETAADKATFRNALRRRRCLIPADGFYEWKGGAGAKKPFCIRRRDGDLFAFAGLWETATSAGGGEIDTVAALTTEAGSDLETLHDREPVVVARHDYARWLGETPGAEPDALNDMLLSRPAGFWSVFAVSSHVNNARNEGEACVKPLTA